ncbi:MAG: polyprenyl synthetase family protein [Pseudomonadota bacterium]
MKIDAINALIDDDMADVDHCITTRLASDVALINQLSAYIVGAGGKRLRPRLLLLAAHACGYREPSAHTAAAIVEFIHTATLLHDDVVDESKLRRGRETANERWGNEAAVLVGDFLYSRAFEMMVDINSMRIMQILASTTNTIAEGEVLQLMNIHDADTTKARYWQVIEAKTAVLFAAATRIGAVLAEQPDGVEDALARYGSHLGRAFQLVDDALDYSSDSDTLGKEIGDDLAEGKPTMPLLIALERATAAEQTCIRDAIETGGRDRIDDVMAVISRTDAIAETQALAKREADAAVAALAGAPQNAYTEALSGLAYYAVGRDH